jgi:dienelactone hydrolase
MFMARIVSLFIFACVVAGSCVAQGMASQRIVELRASDGTMLKGTYFASATPGPGVLLLHQCNQQRKLWDPLGMRLAAAGINALTIDYRGYGESGGTPHEKLAPEEEQKIETEKWTGDIEVAYQYLLAQPGVTRDRTGAGGASCGVDNAVKLARRHPEAKALVLLAGPTDRAGREFLHESKSLAIFTSAADDDAFAPQTLPMQWLFSISLNPASRFAKYPTGGHGAEMFALDIDLPGILADWFLATLANKPERAPKTNGFPLRPEVLRALTQIDETGGNGAKQIAKGLGRSPQQARDTALLPEFIVNQLGYEHLQMGDLKGAIEILKLNVIAYPDSANVYDSVSDAYLADGQKELALQNAQKAVDLLAHDAADNEQRRNGIRDSAEQKIKQLGAAHP